MKNSGHCTQVAIYSVTPAVNTSGQALDIFQSAALVTLTVDQPFAVAQMNGEQVAELNTGPPPDNLVVELHRFLI